jgi:hypothetical protein
MNGSSSLTRSRPSLSRKNSQKKEGLTISAPPYLVLGGGARGAGRMRCLVGSGPISRRAGVRLNVRASPMAMLRATAV